MHGPIVPKRLRKIGLLVRNNSWDSMSAGAELNLKPVYTKNLKVFSVLGIMKFHMLIIFSEWLHKYMYNSQTEGANFSRPSNHDISPYPDNL